MGFFDNFPYTNFHNLNLDWILKTARENNNAVEQLTVTVENFKNNLEEEIAGIVTNDFLNNLVLDALHKNGVIINVNEYGANPENENNAEFFQKAFDAAKILGGMVFIPAGTYRIVGGLSVPDGVSIVGEHMRRTVLQLDGGTCFNISNSTIHGCVFGNFSIINIGSQANSYGFFGGSTLAEYNSAIAVFFNIYFENFYAAIDGTSAPAGVGIFDSLFINIWTNSCYMGFHLCGSQNVIIHPRVTLCNIGINIDWLNGESFDGGAVVGGVFVQNDYDINISNVNGHRPYSFLNCWFEQAKYGIINVPYQNTKGLGLSFLTCMFNSNSTLYDLFNVNNYEALCKWFNCTVIQTLYNGNIYVSPSVDYDCYTVAYYDGTRKIIKPFERGRAVVDMSAAYPKIEHELGVAPSTVFVSAVGEGVPAVTVATKAFDICTINKIEGYTDSIEVDYIFYR